MLRSEGVNVTGRHSETTDQGRHIILRAWRPAIKMSVTPPTPCLVPTIFDVCRLPLEQINHWHRSSYRRLDGQLKSTKFSD